MRVAIVGSRDWSELDQVRDYVRRIASKYPDAVIVSGGAKGVDQAAEKAAKHYGLSWQSFRPFEASPGIFQVKLVEPVTPRNPFVTSETMPGHFPSYGQAAFARNRRIVADADVVVAFQHRGSRGTQHSIDIARDLGKPVHVYES